MAKEILNKNLAEGNFFAGRDINIGDTIINQKIIYPTKPGQKIAMISGISIDQPEYLKQVMDACYRMSICPVVMKQLSISGNKTITDWMEMVDEADLYIGIFPYRCFYAPEGNTISNVEMEYRRAVELNVPRFIFIPVEDQLTLKAIIEMDDNEERFRVFKEKIAKENNINFFTSLVDLRAKVVNSLSQLLKHNDTSNQFHYIHPITLPPEPYVAHPYTLSQTTGLIGRYEELNVLTDWITEKDHLAEVRIFNVIAMGGVGKSALIWEWFSNIAPQEWPKIAGRFWWSFYESDAYFENFIIRALAYVSRSTPDEVKKISASERETALLHILDREPHLLVLDGLERIFIAYTRMDAAYLSDEDYDKQTANFFAQARNLSTIEKDFFTDGDGHRLRKTADPRAGHFLKKLAKIKASRILVSSRLYPFDLQVLTGYPLPGCHAVFLKGLNDDDALALWRYFRCTGAQDELLKMFKIFDNHPLLIQALAGEISRWRAAPGDFDRWRIANPDFDPFLLPLAQVKSHILLYAMNGIRQPELSVLITIAALRMPISYSTLRDLLVKKQRTFWQRLFSKNQNWIRDEELDILMQNLENRGLIGWNRIANRYDLHPVIRGVIWSNITNKDKRITCSVLNDHFIKKAKQTNWKNIKGIEDLTPSIELFYINITLQRQLHAFMIFMRDLDDLILYKIGKYRLAIDMLEEIWQDPRDHFFELKGLMARFIRIDRVMFNTIALSYKYAGEPHKSVEIFEAHIPIEQANSDVINSGYNNLFSAMCNFLDTLMFVGKLKHANKILDDILNHPNLEKFSFTYYIAQSFRGDFFSLCGNDQMSQNIFLQSIEDIGEKNDPVLQVIIYSFFSAHYLRIDHPNEALFYANKAWELAQIIENSRHLSTVARHQGAAALALQNYSIADERLHYALIKAREVEYIEGDLPALITLDNLAHQQGKLQEARDLLDDVWEFAERGPYPIFHADACNILCQIERDAGNMAKAIGAATQAFHLSWCDGPPWAYRFGLENAKKHLRELGVEEPKMEIEL